MKNPERVAELIAELRTLTETPIERAVVDRCEKDLSSPPAAEVVDEEEWRDIEGFNGSYKISNFGRVKSFARVHPRILTPTKMYDEYLRVVLSKNGETTPYAIHRLVAQAFIPNPANLPVVDHINGKKDDNRVENLEWVSSSENVRRAYKLGLATSAKGEKHYAAKLTNAQADQIRNQYIAGDSEYGMAGLAQKYGVSRSVISGILHGQSYKPTDTE